MASVGSQLTAPEAGWKRIEDDNTFIRYYGDFVSQKDDSSYSNGNAHYSGNVDSRIEFLVYTDKIRIIQRCGTQFNSNDDKIIIDGNEYILNSRDAGGNHGWIGQIITYENLNMGKKVHHIIMLAGTGSNEKLNLDAFDISDDGYILEFGKQLIKCNDKYYTIENSAITEITEEITPILISDKGLSTSEIIENINLLPEKFTLISNEKNSISINGIKDSKELLVSSNIFSIKIVDFIDEIKSVYSINNSNSSIKIAFSIDNGVTWKGNNFENLSAEIPIKSYSTLTEEEKIKWNNAKENIYNNGIRIEDLNTLDFNSLGIFDNIRFAYVISVADAKDVCKLTSTTITYDEKPTYQIMKDSEIDVYMNHQQIRITPHISSDEIKVNISSNGILSNDTVIDNLTEDQINKLKIKLGL